MTVNVRLVEIPPVIHLARVSRVVFLLCGTSSLQPNRIIRKTGLECRADFFILHREDARRLDKS